MNRDDIPQPIADMIQGFGMPHRSPILRTPSEANLQYDDVFFPSEDGTPLEAWYMPCNGSDKLIIVNHPMTFSRYGFPAHLPPWNHGIADFGGNDLR